MVKARGIDISQYQGKINWAVVKNEIDFVLIRCNIGANGIDENFEYNVNEAAKYKIPFGFYCMSYAYSIDTAIKEAEKITEFAKRYKPRLPIFFDWEYDSADYARLKGADVSPTFVKEITEAFLTRVKSNGFDSGIYTNEDYIQKYYGEDYIASKILWIADWYSETKRNYKIWQYKSNGRINGINEIVDMDYMMIDDGQYAIDYLVKHNLVFGDENGIRPKDNITREETFILLKRLIDYLKGTS